MPWANGQILLSSIHKYTRISPPHRPLALLVRVRNTHLTTSPVGKRPAGGFKNSATCEKMTEHCLDRHIGHLGPYEWSVVNASHPLLQSYSTFRICSKTVFDSPCMGFPIQTIGRGLTNPIEDLRNSEACCCDTFSGTLGRLVFRASMAHSTTICETSSSSVFFLSRSLEFHGEHSVPVVEIDGTVPASPSPAPRSKSIEINRNQPIIRKTKNSQRLTINSLRSISGYYYAIKFVVGTKGPSKFTPRRATPVANALNYI